MKVTCEKGSEHKREVFLVWFVIQWSFINWFHYLYRLRWKIFHRPEYRVEHKRADVNDRRK